MFDFLKKTKKPNPDASRLLASILVVFPAVQSVTYDSKDETLEFSFALNGKFSQDDIEDFLAYVAESVETFHHLEGLGGAKIELNVEGVYGTCFLNVRRVFAVDDNHVDIFRLFKFGRLFHEKISAGSADDIADH